MRRHVSLLRELTRTDRAHIHRDARQLGPRRSRRRARSSLRLWRSFSSCDRAEVRSPASKGNDLRYMLDAVRRSEHEKDVLADSLRVAQRTVYAPQAARANRREARSGCRARARVRSRPRRAARGRRRDLPPATAGRAGRGNVRPRRYGRAAPAAARTSGGSQRTRDDVRPRGPSVELLGPGAIRAGLTLNLLDADDIPSGSAFTVLAGGPTDARDRRRRDSGEELARAIAAPIANGVRYRDAARRAEIDGLTQLRHNTAFRASLSGEVARSHRYNRKVALLVADVDDFKLINDRSGHLAGDAILAELGARLTGLVRVADIPCRIGGDEFAVILPESTTADALRLFERLQAGAREHDSFAGAHLSFSGGICRAAARRAGGAVFRSCGRGAAGSKGQGQESGPPSPATTSIQTAPGDKPRAGQ